MDSGLSPQDKKDLDKFIKFFALKVRFACLSGFFVFQWDEEKKTAALIQLQLADRPGDRPSPPRAENLHPLVVVAHRLRLGKVLVTQPSLNHLWKTPSHYDRPHSSPSQFNLAIKDIPEVTHEAKKALAGQLPGIGRSMCVEISLKTSEVKTLIVLDY